MPYGKYFYLNHLSKIVVLINEWLPNPVGKDAEGEWVEIFNNGSEAVSLSGWFLKTKAKTKFLLSGEIPSGGFSVSRKPELKLSLNNVDGEVFLYDANGRLADHARFYGSAPEGRSYSLQNFSSQNLGGQARNFMFSEPTLGHENKFEIQENLVGNIYPSGVLVEGALGTGGFFGLVLGVAVILTGAALFVIKRNESLSNLFFRRDEDAWQ